MINRFAACITAVGCFALAGPAQAHPAKEGVVQCGGNQFLRLSGSEMRFTTWTLRNFDPATPISIRRLQVFDARGNVLFDSASSGLPASDEGLLGPANNSLWPNQTSVLDTLTIIDFLPPTNRPVQMRLEWTAAKPVQPLSVVTTGFSRGRDPATGRQLEDRAIYTGECIAVR